MEITSLQLYFVLMLDGVNGLLTSLGSILAAGILFIAIGGFLYIDLNTYGDESKEPKQKLIKWIKRMSILCAVIWSLAVITPTTKQMAAIIVLPHIINNEKVQKIPEQLIDVLGLSLEELKSELTDKKEGK